MKATFKSREDFEADGFKWDYPKLYKGLKKEPEATVNRHVVENLGGKEVTVLSVEDADRGLLLVERHGHTYRVNTWMLRETVLFEKIVRPSVYNVKGRRAKYYGLNFSFPCACEEMTTDEAVKMAKWVLRVAKDRP